MKAVLKMFQVPAMVLFMFLVPASVFAVAAPALEITESFDGNAIIEYTVNTQYDDIIGFAVGNNNYLYLWAQTSISGWKATVAVDNPNKGGWVIPVYSPGTPPVVKYNSIPGGFNLGSLSANGYGKAFLFYKDAGSALPSGLSTGFFGLAYDPDSSFVAFRANGEVITGETNLVPVPSAAILLFSGLIGLIGVRRR